MIHVTNADRGSNRGLLVFIEIVYALSIGISLVVGLTGGYQSRFAFPFGVIAMFIPSIAVLIVSSWMKEKVSSFVWNGFPVRYLTIALFLMPTVMHAVMLPVAAAVWGGLPWEDWLKPQSDGLFHTPLSRGWGVRSTRNIR